MKVVDLSYANGIVDFDAIKRDGVEGVIIRDGYGRETWQKDAQFERNYAEAKRVGLHVGCYHYAYFADGDDAEREAYCCMEIIKGKQFDFPVYFDIEERCSIAAINDGIERFCSILEKNGYFVGVYTSKSVLENNVSEYNRNRYAIWLANWTNNVNIKSEYKGQYGCWQYTEKGSVVGIINCCDLDLMIEDYPSIIINGGFNNYPKKQDSSSVSENDSSNSVVEKPVETVEPVTVAKPMTYKIEWGDTLTAIAKKFGTTVPKLKKWNNIKNVNMIYAGDTIFVSEPGDSNVG